jgi:pyrroline-5-carboxylate reductase
MLTKQANMLTAAHLNDVNDALMGGVVVSVPAGAPIANTSQLIAGDRIVLDDPTAYAMSDLTVATLLGGVYMYVKSTAVTRQAVRGGIAFFKTADLGVQYAVYSDADPSTSVPTHVAGIYINAITSGSFGWIQVAGAAGVLFDTLTSAADGTEVTVKISPNTASTADAGAVPTATTVAAHLGVACGLPSSTVISTVMLTRGTFCGRI